MSSSASSSSRPSDARRKALNEELTIPLVSNFFPIERYYDAADKVYESFEEVFLVGEKRGGDALDDAYVYGKRYCLFCIDAIPEHNYYNSAKHRHLQTKHNKQVNAVIEKIATVALLMDKEEVERQRLLELQQRRLEEEQNRQTQLQYEKWQRRVQQQKQASTSSSKDDVEAAALSKLEMLRKPSQQQNGVVVHRALPHNGPAIPRDPSGGEHMLNKQASARHGVFDDSSDDDALPPPVLPPPPPSTTSADDNSSLPPPPSYQQIQSQSHRQFLGPSRMEPSAPPQPYAVPPSSVPPPQQQRPQKQPQRPIPMKQLQQQYKQQYLQHQQQGRIQVRALPTYQGRVDASTNGCTVISALVAARHLSSNADTIADAQIATVMDRECGPLLRQIRSKLGLGGHALIIPSDVHDHLVDLKILSQSFFEGAAGGNIMDPDHIGEFTKLLSVGDDGKGQYCKAAATLFFREHVVSIVKKKNTQQYDFIDSLPSTLNGSSINGNGSNGGLAATRTTCCDLPSLQVLLHWYASRKFTDANCSYIDRNAWDDRLADFDPRVFQGFVWMVKA